MKFFARRSHRSTLAALTAAAAVASCASDSRESRSPASDTALFDRALESREGGTVVADSPYSWVAFQAVLQSQELFVETNRLLYDVFVNEETLRELPSNAAFNANEAKFLAEKAIEAIDPVALAKGYVDATTWHYWVWAAGFSGMLLPADVRDATKGEVTAAFGQSLERHPWLVPVFGATFALPTVANLSTMSMEEQNGYGMLVPKFIPDAFFERMGGIVLPEGVAVKRGAIAIQTNAVGSVHEAFEHHSNITPLKATPVQKVVLFTQQGFPAFLRATSAGNIESAVQIAILPERLALRGTAGLSAKIGNSFDETTAIAKSLNATAAVFRRVDESSGGLVRTSAMATTSPLPLLNAVVGRIKENVLRPLGQSSVNTLALMDKGIRYAGTSTRTFKLTEKGIASAQVGARSSLGLTLAYATLGGSANSSASLRGLLESKKDPARIVEELKRNAEVSASIRSAYSPFALALGFAKEDPAHDAFLGQVEDELLRQYAVNKGDLDKVRIDIEAIALKAGAKASDLGFLRYLGMVQGDAANGAGDADPRLNEADFYRLMRTIHQTLHVIEGRLESVESLEKSAKRSAFVKRADQIKRKLGDLQEKLRANYEWQMKKRIEADPSFKREAFEASLREKVAGASDNE